MVAVCQARSDVRGGSYYRKKIAEGKSRKEALRCLKRRVCDAVLRSLMARLASALARCRLTKRSRELRKAEVQLRIIYLTKLSKKSLSSVS